MGKDNVLLGRVREDRSEFPIYLEKHQWSCGWMYSLGYVGNKNCHFHFSEYLKGNEWDVATIFQGGTVITQNNWWVICDLFKQAYALQACAEIYQYGGHLTTAVGITELINSKDKANAINLDLKIVLESLWELLLVATSTGE